MTRAQQRIQEVMDTQEGKEELIGNNLVPEPRMVGSSLFVRSRELGAIRMVDYP